MRRVYGSNAERQRAYRQRRITQARPSKELAELQERLAAAEERLAVAEQRLDASRRIYMAMKAEYAEILANPAATAISLRAAIVRALAIR